MNVLESLPDRPLTEDEVTSLDQQADGVEFIRLTINAPEITGVMVRSDETYYVLDYAEREEWSVWESGAAEDYQDAAKQYSEWRSDRAAET